jgi:hypothetical protein
VTSRGLAVAWVLVPVLFIVALAWELATWRALAAERARAQAERQRLGDEIRLREQQLGMELRSQAALLGEMQWSSPGSDPGAFLVRLAELVEQKRIKVVAIEPRESQTTPQFVKSWHTVRIQAPYREVRDLAARVEADRGIVEDVHIDAPPPALAGNPLPVAGTPADEVQARFRLTALDLSPAARQILERVAAARGGAAGATALILPVPAGAPPPLVRDPFAFPAGTVRVASRPGPAAPPAPGPAPVTAPAPPIAVSGIVSFPEGYLAIVNDQIVKVGDTVSGHRIERITSTTVTVRHGRDEPRTLSLPELSIKPAPRAPRR